jgi:hypothetical protein
MLMQLEAAQILVRPVSSESSAPESAQLRPAQTQQRRSIGEDRSAPIQASEVTTNNTPKSDLVLITSRRTPAKKEVLAAVRRSFDARSERLVQGGSLDSQPSVGVVDSFRVMAIDLQGDSGFAELEISQRGAFEYGKAIARRTTARHHVILSRQQQGWVLVMPQDLMCLNRDLAVAALTDHLATVPPTPANGPELKASRKLLHELSSERSLWDPRTWFRLSRSSGKA